MLQKRGHYPNLLFFIGAVTQSAPFLLVTQFIGTKSSNGRQHGFTLQGHIKEINSKQFIKILSDIVAGLKFLRSNSYTHNDIKSDNILLLRESKTSYCGILNDFGKARSLTRLKHSMPTNLQKALDDEKLTGLPLKLEMELSHNQLRLMFFSFGLWLKKVLLMHSLIQMSCHP